MQYTKKTLDQEMLVEVLEVVKIRKGVFETNSSSVHSLTVSKKASYTPEEAKSFEVSLLVRPFSPEDFEKYQVRESLWILDTVEDRLRYLWTVGQWSGVSGKERASKLIHSIFPNVSLQNITNFDDVAYIEDCEFLFDDDDFEEVVPCDQWDKETWRKWFLKGYLIVYSRDEYRNTEDIDEWGDVRAEDKRVTDNWKRVGNEEDYTNLTWEG